MTQNFDVLLMLTLFCVASYYGILKPTLEASKVKDRKALSNRQDVSGNREVKVVIDNLTQTEITFELSDEKLQDEKVILTKTLRKLTAGGCLK